MALNDLKYKSAPGALNTATSSGITFPQPQDGLPSVVEYKDGLLHRTEITLPEFSWTTTAAAKAVGQLLYTFPNGFILPVAAYVSANITSVDASTAGEIGLGAVIGSGPAAVLSGTATFENILTGQTMGNGTATVAHTEAFAAAAGGTSGTTDVIDGSSTSVSLFLNIASTWGGTGGATVNSGRVTVIWLKVDDD